MKNAFDIEDLTRLKECLCDEDEKMVFEKLTDFVGLFQLLPQVNLKLKASLNTFEKTDKVTRETRSSGHRSRTQST